MRWMKSLILAIFFYLVLTACFPSDKLISEGCFNGLYTEVAVPRAGVGYPPLQDMEADVDNWPESEAAICLCDTGVQLEYDSGFGWEFVDFDGTPATFKHLIAVFYEDTVLVPGAADTVSVTLNYPGRGNGNLCVFETFSQYGIYNRLILLRSFLFDASGDTLAQRTDYVGRRVYVVPGSQSCPDTLAGCYSP